MSFASFSICEKKTVLSESQLPSKIKAYVDTHFSGHSIVQIIKDKDNFELTYGVMLTESITLEFNRKKEIIGIDENKNFGLPNSVISKKTLTHIQSNYPSNYIVGRKIINLKISKLILTMNLDLFSINPITFCDSTISDYQYIVHKVCILLCVEKI